MVLDTGWALAFVDILALVPGVRHGQHRLPNILKKRAAGLEAVTKLLAES